MAEEIRMPKMPSIKKWNVLFYVLVFLAISFGRKFLDFVTDYYWFQEIGFISFFTKSFLTELLLGVLSAIFVWAILFTNLLISRKICKKPFIVIEPDASITSPFPLPQLEDLKPFIQTLLLIFTFVVAFIMGNRSAVHWETVLKFLNGVPFGLSDPQFGRDIGFYIFNLPFYRFLYNLVLGSILFSALITSANYLLHSRIYLTEKGIHIADDTKVHLAILGGLFCLLMAFHFQLKMFDLLYGQRVLAPGAGYSDINAYLPCLKFLRYFAVIAALLLWSYPWLPDRKIKFVTLSAAALLLIGGSILARIYTEVIQKFAVAPNEIVRETPYIKLGIQFTREAYGLTAIQEHEFDPKENLTADALRRNDLTIKNIRLWEHRPLLTSYGQLQEIRTYYDFLDADNDRYWVNGEYRQVMLSVRELTPESLPSRIWINEHLTYTHGYGICVGPVNRISPEGLPEFFIKDIPPVSNTNLIVTRPEIYYGESRAGYVIVNTKSKEFDYPSGEENVYNIYEGSGGVPIRSFLRKLLFALTFGEIKILFSGDITAQSKVLYYRHIRERLSKSAPFIRFDNDPYMVISEEGKLFWIVDGYCVSDRYPYSENTAGINYIRNSVKATVDAYNGTAAFYISDPKDPIIQTYSKIFPEMFQPIDQMPADLRQHIRYPQTLLNIQARIYATYHMTDPQVFYNKEDLWKIPVRTASGRSDPMEPYYTIMKLAGVGGREEFILMAPFTPAKKENMISWMAARCDEPNYGKLMVYNFPKQKLVYGPQQIESRIDQDAEISKQLTLWDQGGSRVIRGNLLVIPVDQSLLYVQPLYLEATGGGLPELKRIIVAYGNTIVMEENLELSLLRIFGGKIDRPLKDLAQPQAVSHVKSELKGLAREIKIHFDNAQRAARQGDWAGYGNEMKMMERLLNRLSESQ